jgi:release factor glutamine methyltransferase
MTIQELYTKGKSLLADFPEASVQSKVLVKEALGISDEEFYSHPERAVSKTEEERFDGFVRKRQEGMPLAYVTGEKEFWSLPFQVNPGVLIPRPETELLVAKVIELSSDSDELIVDIGTGSGVIAISLATELPHARFLATDISASALKIARLNAFRHHTENIEFMEGNLFCPLKDLNLDGQCDFILSNPPYVPNHLWETLQNDTQRHEPKKALVGGETGLEIIQGLISGAPKFLKNKGYLCIEIGFDQRDDVKKMFGMGWTGIHCFEDLNGVPRVIVGQRLISSHCV